MMNNLNSSLVLGMEPLVPVMGVAFDAISFDDAFYRLQYMANSKVAHFVVTANLDFAKTAHVNPEFRRLLSVAHLVVCDGMPLVWISKLGLSPLPERVAGSDLLPALLAYAATAGLRVFFLGGKPSNLSRAVESVKRRYPALILDSFSPPYRPLSVSEDLALVERIREFSPNFLFVALGCPYQEAWISEHLKALNVPVSIGVGASIDFLSGCFLRAPQWAQKMGVEWFFRLLQEPKRLIPRYYSDFIFFVSSLSCLFDKRFKVSPSSSSFSFLSGFDSFRLPVVVDKFAVEKLNCIVSDVMTVASLIYIDCSKVQKFDSVGLGFILRLYRNLMHTGLKPQLCGLKGELLVALRNYGVFGPFALNVPDYCYDLNYNEPTIVFNGVTLNYCKFPTAKINGTILNLKFDDIVVSNADLVKLCDFLKSRQYLPVVIT